jgi:alcohol dehydrogenase
MSGVTTPSVQPEIRDKQAFDFYPRTRVIYGSGAFAQLGELARELGFTRTLLVADHGIAACGYVDEAARQLELAGIACFRFHDFGENPDTAMVEAGRVVAAAHQVDSIIGLGGGSSLDTAKGINFVLTNGGTMRDYWGQGKASSKPGGKLLLPMIGIPTTAGTGSEAQSYALISDAETHVKMACGDPQAKFKLTILDPRLTVTQPAYITATAGYDAIAHALETYVSTKRNPLSEMFAREAWRLLSANYAKVLVEPNNLAARSAMLLGAHYAGVAIENSMLGAAHACANPLTARYGTTHGEALAILLPQVIRWNLVEVGERYDELCQSAQIHCASRTGGEQIARRLAQLAQTAGLPTTLSSLGVPRADLPELAEAAAQQWTGTFNPRQWSAAGAKEIYEWAF